MQLIKNNHPFGILANKLLSS